MRSDILAHGNSSSDFFLPSEIFSGIHTNIVEHIQAPQCRLTCYFMAYFCIYWSTQAEKRSIFHKNWGFTVDLVKCHPLHLCLAHSEVIFIFYLLTSASHCFCFLMSEGVIPNAEEQFFQNAELINFGLLWHTSTIFPHLMSKALPGFKTDCFLMWCIRLMCFSSAHLTGRYFDTTDM